MTHYVWKIKDGGECHYVIALDADDALKVLSETDGHQDAAAFETLTPEVVPGLVSVWDEDGNTKTTKPAAEWATEGRGYLAGTMYR